MTDGQQQYVGGVCGSCIVPVIIMVRPKIPPPPHRNTKAMMNGQKVDERRSEPEK